MAEVNDKGDVSVDGAVVGKIEGFRFQPEASGSSDEAVSVRSAVEEALKPELHLRADRFYNAPDTEMDFTEQGGLMWGSAALGKLVKGSDVLKPLIEVFVDESAGDEVADKVRRRLQHFMDRKISALFGPLETLAADESLDGTVRNLATRLVESLGVLARQNVAQEVKSLDQEARGALRKHGVRFGQFTIFMPVLLKPAPTRLRLVLYSLWNDLSTFPESPPPGLVTIPNIADLPKTHYTLAGYHPAGTRAIRIDMLERLADMIRRHDARAGFEASADMLSITGMTLDQFADLMEGLGYKGEKGERPKVKAAPELAPIDPALVQNPVPEEVSLIAPDLGALAEASPPTADLSVAAAPEGDSSAADSGAAVSQEASPVAPDSGADLSGAAEESDPVPMERFYTFVWAPKPRAPRPTPQRSAPEGKAKAARPPSRNQSDKARGPSGKKGAAGGKASPEGRQSLEKKSGGANKSGRGRGGEGKPARYEKPIDPDNPFAALMALKGKL